MEAAEETEAAAGIQVGAAKETKAAAGIQVEAAEGTVLSSSRHSG